MIEKNNIIHKAGCGWETGPWCTCGADPARMKQPMKLFGEHDPTGGDGYVPGAWDQVRDAYFDRRISDEAYELVHRAVYGYLPSDVMAERLHEAMEWQYDSCDHGTYSGGPNAGEPYKMCEILTKRMRETQEPLTW